MDTWRKQWFDSLRVRMSRNTPTELKDIFETDLSDASLQVWLDIASEVTDDVQDADSSISSTRLKQIEKLLGAHFASSQDQRVESASRETASVSYQGETAMNLKGTKYGQQAVGLDPTGVLSSYGMPKASVSTPRVKDFNDRL